MIKNLVVTTWMFTLVLTGGCFFGTAETPTTYELSNLEQYPLAQSINIGQVRNLTPVLLNMIYINDGGMIISDGARRWAQTPDRMIQRSLLRALASGQELELSGEVLPVTLDVEIFDFHMDLMHSQAVLGAKYTLGFRKDRKSKVDELIRTVNLTESCADSSPESLAVAMSRCVDRLAKSIADDLEKQK